MQETKEAIKNILTKQSMNNQGQKKLMTQDNISKVITRKK